MEEQEKENFRTEQNTARITQYEEKKKRKSAIKLKEKNNNNILR